MLGDGDLEMDVPRAVTATDDERRFLDTAFALGGPGRMAILRELMQRESPLSLIEIAGRLNLDKDETQTHLDALLEAGLVNEKRRGLRREKVYITGISDIEIRFYGGKRPQKVRKRTKRDISHEAKKRERLEKKRERQEAKIAKKRTR